MTGFEGRYPKVLMFMKIEAKSKAIKLFQHIRALYKLANMRQK